MTINDASKLLNALSSQTVKKAEKKVYKCFIKTLTALKNKDLSENQLQLIEEKLSSLNLKAITENKKKYYRQKLSEFKAFLKSKLSLTPEGYYRETWMVYGMIFGTSIGTAIGTVINVINETSIGLSIGLSIGTGVGMLLGMLYGAAKDAEAKKQKGVF